MAGKKENPLRSSLKMTNAEKKEMIELNRSIKSNEEFKKAKKIFYEEHGLRPSRIDERWQKDADS